MVRVPEDTRGLWRRRDQNGSDLIKTLWERWHRKGRAAMTVFEKGRIGIFKIRNTEQKYRISKIRDIILENKI